MEKCLSTKMAMTRDLMEVAQMRHHHAISNAPLDEETAKMRIM